ncbi:MAG TPA: hypothetical protein VGQ86_10635, partial [Candidatus Limnocylindria bacterium]|nr:hypothetical protein [Candidatus Limnocylindria bacterium]
MLKRAVAVGYIAFFAYTLLPGLLYQIGGGQPSMTTVTLFATIGSALGAIAYLLVRKNERVVFER